MQTLHLVGDLKFTHTIFPAVPEDERIVFSRLRCLSLKGCIGRIQVERVIYLGLGQTQLEYKLYNPYGPATSFITLPRLHIGKSWSG